MLSLQRVAGHGISPGALRLRHELRYGDLVVLTGLANQHKGHRHEQDGGGAEQNDEAGE